LHLVGILFPHINDDARSKSLQSKFRVTLKFQERNPDVSRKLSAASHTGTRDAPSIDSMHHQVEHAQTRKILPSLTQEKRLFHQIRDLQEWGRHNDFRVTRSSNLVRVKAVPTS